MPTEPNITPIEYVPHYRPQAREPTDNPIDVFHNDLREDLM